MQPRDESAKEQGRCEQSDQGHLLQAEQELLARVRSVAQQITDRVRKALGNEHPELPPPDPNGPQPTPA